MSVEQDKKTSQGFFKRVGEQPSATHRIEKPQLREPRAIDVVRLLHAIREQEKQLQQLQEEISSGGIKSEQRLDALAGINKQMEQIQQSMKDLKLRNEVINNKLDKLSVQTTDTERQIIQTMNLLQKALLLLERKSIPANDVVKAIAENKANILQQTVALIIKTALLRYGYLPDDHGIIVSHFENTLKITGGDQAGGPVANIRTTILLCYAEAAKRLQEKRKDKEERETPIAFTAKAIA